MNRTIAILSFLILVTETLIGQNIYDSINLKNVRFFPDTSDYVFIPYNKKIFPKGHKPTTLTKSDFIDLIKLFINATNDYNIRKTKEINSENELNQNYNTTYLIDLTDYKIQIRPMLNKQNQKEVNIFCFCKRVFEKSEYNSKVWKTEIINPADGGKCYFQLLINLSTKTVIEIYIHNAT